MSQAPDECGQCGAAIPRGALACPECGADEETGWDANPWEQDPGEMEVPELYHEEGERPPIFENETWTKPWVLLVAVVVLVVMLWFLLGGR